MSIMVGDLLSKTYVLKITCKGITECFETPFLIDQTRIDKLHGVGSTENSLWVTEVE